MRPSSGDLEGGPKCVPTCSICPGNLAPIWHQIETLLAVVLLTFTLVQTERMIGAMATSSLSTDEFGTVGGYSRRGPIYVATDYRAPKNHIFFNLVNSLFPGRASLEPWRARLFSFIAAGLFLAGLITYSTMRGQLFEGAVILTLWTFSRESLQLCLEARGYGFLAFAGLTASIATLEFSRTKRSAWLYAVAGAVVLGSYTLPGFLFFGGPLLLLLWMVHRDRRTFYAGVGAAIAIGVLYSPVFLQLLSAFRNYGDQYESGFLQPSGIERAVNLYLLWGPGWLVGLFCAVLVVAPWVSRDRGERIVMGATLVFFAILLITRSSPIRMANVAMVPFAVAGIFAVGSWLRNRSLPVRASVFGAAGLLLMVGNFPILRAFSFTPHENWLDAGKAIDQAFDPGIRVDFKRYAKYLGNTIHEPDRRSASFDEATYLRGQMVVVDASNKWSTGRQFFRPKEEAHNAEIEIPGAARDMVLTFQIPGVSGLLHAPRELTDRATTTGIALGTNPLILDVTAIRDLRAIVLLFNRPLVGDIAGISGIRFPENTHLSVIRAGNAIILNARGLFHSGDRLEFRLSNAVQGNGLTLVEAWASF